MSRIIVTVDSNTKDGKIVQWCHGEPMFLVAGIWRCAYCYRWFKD